MRSSFCGFVPALSHQTVKRGVRCFIAGGWRVLAGKAEMTDTTLRAEAARVPSPMEGLIAVEKEGNCQQGITRARR